MFIGSNLNYLGQEKYYRKNEAYVRATWEIVISGAKVYLERLAVSVRFGLLFARLKSIFEQLQHSITFRVLCLGFQAEFTDFFKSIRIIWNLEKFMFFF